MSLKKGLKEKGLLVSSILMIAILLLELFFRDDLFAASLNIIMTLQTKLPAFTRYIFHIAAGLGDPDIILPVYLLILSLQVNKYFLVKLGLYICFIGYLLSVVKTIYGNPRPYWVRPYVEGLPGYVPNGIQPYEKYAEYGNPSGHSFFVIALYGYLFYIFTINHHKKVMQEDQGIQAPLIDEEAVRRPVQDKNVDLPAEEAAGLTCERKPPISKTLYRILNVVFVVVVILVCMSRMYLGMHALNQVLLGLSLGAFYLYIFVAFVDRHLEDFLKKIAKQELDNRPLVIWSFAVCYLLASILPVALFIQRDDNNSILNSVLWSDWWIVVQKEINPPPNAFAYIRCFLDSGVVGGFFGILLGALASDGSYTETAQKFNTIPKMKLFFRVIVLFLVAGIPAGIVAIVPVPEQNYILNYFIRWNLALFIAGFSATRFVPVFYAKLDLEVEGDFLRVRTSAPGPAKNLLV